MGGQAEYIRFLQWGIMLLLWSHCQVEGGAVGNMESYRYRIYRVIEWRKLRRNGYVRYSDNAQIVIFAKDIVISARMRDIIYSQISR